MKTLIRAIVALCLILVCGSLLAYAVGPAGAPASSTAVASAEPVVAQHDGTASWAVLTLLLGGAAVMLIRPRRRVSA